MSEHENKSNPRRRSERNAAFSGEDESGEADSRLGSSTADDLHQDTGRAAAVDPEFDGFRQPTAMFDKGQFLGELAELVDGVPDTRARAEVEAAAPKGCRLIIVAGPDVGLEWSFKAKEVIIGRDEDCQLVMSDIAVSRRHARISFEDDHFVLTDLSSGNGTFLNGVRVQQETLSPGDEIIVGERTLRFVELNQTPLTSAAVPAQAGLQDPVVGEASPASGDYEALQAPSKVAEPSAAPRRSESPAPVERDSGASGRALQTAFRGLAVAAGLAAAAAGIWFVYARYFGAETAAERAVRIKREFYQGIELVKQLRCGDASILFRRVLLAQPQHPRAPGYVEHCEAQLSHWSHIVAAREMAAARRYIEAIDRLKSVPTDSDYASEAAHDRRIYARSIAYALLEEARAAFEAGGVDKALELVDRGLELAPDLDEARRLRREIADASATPAAGRRRTPKFVVPPRLRRAVTLYKSAKIGAAIDAAEALGGPDAKTWTQRMKAVKKLLAEATVAHRHKAAAALMRIGPEALALDRQVSGGQGKVHARLSKYYADGLYLKAIEALQSSDDVSAFRLFNRALKVLPDHRLSTARLAELGRKARELYYEGYILKEQNNDETRRIFRRLTQITMPSNPYHKLAADWLRAHR